MEFDIYYVVDNEKGTIDRLELAKTGVISVRAGVSLLREEQLGQLAALFSTTIEEVTAILQNPPEPFVYSDSTPEVSESVDYYNPDPSAE